MSSPTMQTGTVYQLYLGKHIEGFNREVSEAEFSRFVEEELINYFDSFTITDGVGYWKGKSEAIKVITIISHVYEDALIVHQIANAYKRSFHQEAVLVNTHSCFPNLI